MQVIFVRHGQTEGNAGHRHQRETGHLTAEGRAQAAAAAAACARHNPTHLIVSPRVRAMETGRAIAQATSLIPEVNELFSELCRPQYIYGYRHASARSFLYMFRWLFGRKGDGCNKEGESYAAFVHRVIGARTYLESLPQYSVVVVVSHSVFINFFLQHIHRHAPLPWWRAFPIILKILSLKNGSVTMLEYNGGEWVK